MKYLYKSKFFLTSLLNTSSSLETIKLSLFLKKSLPSKEFYQNLDSSDFIEQGDVIKNINILNEKINFLNKNILVNNNILSNKLICYSLKCGLKLKAYNYYTDYMSLFFSFFRDFDKDMSENYPLYSMYFEYAQSNKSIFFSSTFIYNNIVGFLEPTFVLTVSKKKKKKKLLKQLNISYVKPSKRIIFCIRLLNVFSKSFKFRTSSDSKCFSLVNTFLSNRNSILYKKKIYTYNKLLQVKKIKK